MNCPKCGQNISSYEICPFCGFNVNQGYSQQDNDSIPSQQVTPQPHSTPSSAPFPTPPVSYPTNQAVPFSKKKGAGKKVGLVLICTLIAVTFFVTIAFVFTSIFNHVSQSGAPAVVNGTSSTPSKPSSEIEKETSEETSQPEPSSTPQDDPVIKSSVFDKVSVVLKSKGQDPKDTENWQFSSYVTFEFEIANHYDKDIKGIQGIAHFNDMFGKEIISMGADFTDPVIAGSTSTVNNLSYEINEFNDADSKLYITPYENLQFQYQVTKIVFTDGTTLEEGLAA